MVEESVKLSNRSHVSLIKDNTNFTPSPDKSTSTDIASLTSLVRYCIINPYEKHATIS